MRHTKIKDFTRYTIFAMIAMIAVCCTGCTDENLAQSGTIGEERVLATLRFGYEDFEPLKLTTRSTLDEVAESRVKDIYLFIFVNGQRVYNHYFGSESQKGSESEVTSSTEECWWVQNHTNVENSEGYTEEDTHGVIRIEAPTMEGATMYLVANANAYTVNISPDKLNTVRTEEDLKALTAQLTGEVFTRYGYFPMTAKVEGVKVDKETVTSTAGDSENGLPARLVRLDAKVEVNIQAATGYSYEYEGTTQTVNTFVPESWKVVNLPKGATVIEDDIPGNSQADYFNTALNGFEDFEDVTFDDGGTTRNTTRHSFSFYMLENKQTPSAEKQITDEDYHKRELRSKKADGTYDTTGDTWQHAPENATYLEIKGYLSMYVEDADKNHQELGADVTYYIHLGNFKSDVNNYQVKRNTHHTYTITVKGVRHIEVEVSTSNDNEEGVTEGQSGAMGDIYVSQSSIMLFDAHYSQYLYSIDANQINIEQMAWYVHTPFGEKGSPKFNPGTTLADYDYRWVWFMLNPVENGEYSTRLQWYPGNKNKTGEEAGLTVGDEKHLMDVNEFVSFVKEQKNIYDADKSDNGVIDGKATVDGVEQTHAFLNGKINFTAFIDEYYYENHPITGEKTTSLWKQFVNERDRLMHILCGSNRSLDGESSVTNSVISIRQRSIQTPYNIDKATLYTAWGCETEDEAYDEQLYLYNEQNLKPGDNGFTAYHSDPSTCKNTSESNGLYNSALMIGLMTQTDETGKQMASYNSNLMWSKFINYENGDIDTQGDLVSCLNDNYKGLLYATLMRNRDNNGDGIINAGELRWYVASIGQLYGIYIGEPGIKSHDAHLYDKSFASEAEGTTVGGSGNYADCRKWRQHIVSSTQSGKVSTGATTVLWAEEGVSVSYYWQERTWSENNWGSQSVRCIRNLGMDYDSEEEAQEALTNESVQPELLIDYWLERNGSTIAKEDIDNITVSVNDVYVFDLTNVNEASLRSEPLGNLEMEATDEYHTMARPYKGFKTGELITSITDYSTLKADYLDLGLSPCPEGYHVPNVREAALMHIYCTKDNWWNSRDIISGSYFSNGTLSGNKVSSPTWYFGMNYASISPYRTVSIRPIMDWQPTE